MQVAASLMIASVGLRILGSAISSQRMSPGARRTVAEAADLSKIQLPGVAQPVDLHFHDIRGTAVTLLSEAGCTQQQIATITGHSLKTVHRILERYLARTRGLAEEAIANFENSPRTKFANQLQTRARKNKKRQQKAL